jgi:4-oxalocrotonate tautomerase family enzyme
MPLVKVEIISGKTKEYKKQLLESIHMALINTLEIEDDDRFQRLYELDIDNFERRSRKTDKFTLIELTLLPGRSKEVKGNVIKEITYILKKNLGIDKSDVIVILHEPPLENWGCYGVQAIELDLHYKKN